MSSAGRRLLSSIVYKQEMGMFLQKGLGAFLFQEGESVLFTFILNHLNNYGVIPTPGTVEETKGLESALVQAPEPSEYYLAEVEKRYLQQQLKKIILSTKEQLDKQDPDAAFQLLLSQVGDLNIHAKRKNLIDFREVSDIIADEYIKQAQQNVGIQKHNSLEFGWPTLDGMSGGIGGGDVCSIIGRPAAGKTFLELYVSHHSWKHGGSPLVISMEMSNLAISQRLAAMEAKKGLTQLLKGMMTHKGYMTLMDALDGNKDAAKPYWLVDGNLTSTVDDIVLLARQLKPSSVLIDGAYLLKHQNNRLTKWDRISENAEMIKQRIAGDLGLPVVCSYQFSREVEKKKKKEGEKAGLGDIYGSDSIGQLSSLVLGLFEEENIETQKCRKVDILKGRKGETGEFLINWDFVGMDFSEIPTEVDATGKKVKSTKDLQFL